eukprot:5767679-Prymnesium_polylepis.1
MGFTQTREDPKHENGRLIGIMCVHVDDLLYTGTKGFCEDLHKALEQVFVISHVERNHFNFNGIEIENTGTEILINQQKYIEENMNIDMQDIKNTAEADRKGKLQTILGKLLW